MNSELVMKAASKFVLDSLDPPSVSDFESLVVSQSEI